MADTYQPDWEEMKEKQNRRHHHHHHHEHHHHDRWSSSHTNSWGGWMKMRDKSAYFGLLFVVFGILGTGVYMLGKMVYDEVKAMPKDDPTTEMNVDVLRIKKVDERNALIVGDSLAQTYNVDSLKHTVQIETRPVYRPPKREDKWYITKREWKRIWQDYKVMRWEREHGKEKPQEE